ncbi:MAG: flippase-like domain-containing protein [Candidatus Binatia bacterium]|nr:flippase-like domain-containing protein [Candidatus Binatia bacterium]
MSRTVRILLTVAVSGVLLFLALRGVEWERAWTTAREIRATWLIPVMAVTIWTLYIRAQRWRSLLRPLGSVPLSPLVHTTNIGFMANMVLPLRAGEIVRPLLLARATALPLGGVLATIVLERVFDLLAVIFLFGIATLLVPVSDEVRVLGYVLVTMGTLLAAGVAVARWQEGRVLRLWCGVAKRLPAFVRHLLDHFVRGFLQALEVLDRPATFLSIVAWTAYLWAIIAAVNTLGLVAFAFAVPLLRCGLVLTAIVALAVSVPSAPGYIGSFQFGCKLALEMFGLAASEALAFSVVLHVAQFVAILLAGLYSLARQGVSFRQLEEVSKSDVSVSAG